MPNRSQITNTFTIHVKQQIVCKPFARFKTRSPYSVSVDWGDKQVPKRLCLKTIRCQTMSVKGY